MPCQASGAEGPAAQVGRLGTPPMSGCRYTSHEARGILERSVPQNAQHSAKDLQCLSLPETLESSAGQKPPSISCCVSPITLATHKFRKCSSKGVYFFAQKHVGVGTAPRGLVSQHALTLEPREKGSGWKTSQEAPERLLATPGM